MEKWMSQNNQWLQWAQTIDMLAQAGLTYTQNPFDIERYHQIREIVANMLAVVSESEIQPIKGLLDAQSGYSTPKLDVRGVVFKEDKILLVKEWLDLAGRLGRCERTAQPGCGAGSVGGIRLPGQSKPFAFHI
jgi:hypothetical protein